MNTLSFKKIILAALLAVSMLNNNVSAFLGRRNKFPIHKAASNFDKSAFNSAIVGYILKDKDCPQSKLINMQDDKGRTPLHVALSVNLTKNNYKEAIPFIKELIFKEKADVNIQDDNGDTPLHYIMDSLYTKKALFAYLLMAGARVDIKNLQGQTVWDKYFNSEEAKKLFANHKNTYLFEIILILMFVDDFKNLTNYMHYIKDLQNKELENFFVGFNPGEKYSFLDLKYALEEVNKFVIDDDKISVETFNAKREENLKRYNI
ncbi:MAG: hypothetical protein ABIA74_04985 [bacterium]